MTAPQPAWGASQADPAAWAGAFPCCDGEYVPTIGPVHPGTRPAIYHSRACPLRGPDGTVPTRAPRPSVAGLVATGTTAAQTAARRRAHSKAWERDWRRSQVGMLADQGLTGVAIAKRLGLRLTTVYKDLDWLREHGRAPSATSVPTTV